MFKNKKFLISSFVLALCMMMVSVTVAGAISYKKSSAKGSEIMVNGGVIRIDPREGVYLHTNETHHSRGITDVRVDATNGGIKVTRDKMNAVISISADPDETIALKDVSIGLSGGGKVSYLFFYKNGRKLNMARSSDYNQVASSTSNVWLTILSEN